jgi:hypothetical protein
MGYIFSLYANFLLSKETKCPFYVKTPPMETFDAFICTSNDFSMFGNVSIGIVTILHFISLNEKSLPSV